MAKRPHDSRGTTVKIKRRNGIRIRTATAPDLDDDNPASNVSAEYARSIKTRVSAAGKAESVTMKSVQILEAKEVPQDNPDPFVNDYEEVITENPISTKKAKKKRKKGNDSTKMLTWLDVRSTVLDEMVALDGPGSHKLDSCNSCGNNQTISLYRCLECSYTLLCCGECIIKSHTALPLHRLECWKDGFFDRTSLYSLGYICHLGHDGNTCPVGSPPQLLTVIDLNGWHKLWVSFCKCSASGVFYEHYHQLLRMSWYPASFGRPKTAFSFNLLDTYHKLTLQGKLNLYDFYHAIMNKSDNQGRSKPLYRYHEISRCMRQWRHLKGVKRGGGAHQGDLLSGTALGSFAVECPACPHPERNLPEDWDSAPGTKKWMHAQFIAVDANFKLKLKNRKIEDPELGSGWSYFVENSGYARHVANNPHERDVESCGTEFHAVNHANSRGGKNYIVSGVVKAVCARHCFVLPNAVGDLQRGERYINTDYIIASYLKRCKVRDIKISYDIACKWSVNLHTRFEAVHEDVDLSEFSITHLVPKFHLPAHGEKCQARYSFNYTRGVGRTHGETVEQEWAYINLAALSTREMGPGARHSALDDSWGGWNWKKLLGLGSLLNANLIKAKEMASVQRKAADDFTATFPHDTILEWRRMVREWEADPSRPNPYISNDRALKISEIRLRLAEEEAKEAESGQRAPHQISASVFIRMGLELEDQQCALSSAFAEKVRSDAQKAALLERRGALLHQIEKWRELQTIYMPGVVNTASEPDQPSRQKAESIKLWLPSQLDQGERESLCTRGVVASERELRFGQLHDALDDLRRTRRVRRGLVTFHKVQLAGEGNKVQTKSRAAVNSVEERIERSVRRYRVARDALLQLDPSGDWQVLYRVLDDCDNRGPGKEPEELPASDGQYVPSWIWLSNPNATTADPTQSTISPDEVNEDMRVEWAQCTARAVRWEEEVDLLQEEMRRVVHFLEWKSNDWLSRTDARAGAVAKEVSLGLSAYARKQASICRKLAIRFCQRWRSQLLSLSLPHAWTTVFLVAKKAPLDNPDVNKPKRKPKRSGSSIPEVTAPPCGEALVTTAAVASPTITAHNASTTIVTPSISTTAITLPAPTTTVTSPVSIDPETNNYDSSDDSDESPSEFEESESELSD